LELVVAVARLVRGVLACLAAPLIAVGAGVGVAAADEGPAADLALESKPFTGEIGSHAQVPLIWHNYGPGIVSTGGYVSDIRLPTGTEFWYDEVPTYCEVVTPRTHLRCRSVTMGYPDYDNPSGVAVDGYPYTIDVRILQECTTPGEARIEYDNDPNPANNVAPLVLTAKAGDCASGSPSPRPSRTAAPSASASAGHVSGGGAGESTGLPVTGVPTAALAASGALLALGGAGLVLIGRRRRI
jgi:hypothetical protein